MSNTGATIAAVGVSIGAALANLDPATAEGWVKAAAYAGGTSLLVVQLVLCYRRLNELTTQLTEALQKCASCPLAQAANDKARELMTGHH